MIRETGGGIVFIGTGCGGSVVVMETGSRDCGVVGDTRDGCTVAA